MTQHSPDLSCPVCGTELSMAQLFASQDTQAAFARLAVVSVPLGARVLQYCTLFAPPKTRLTVPKQVKLIMQLLPDLERRAVTHRGREWAVPLSVWAQAFDQMAQALTMGKLDLPMKGHGYLYAILVGLADKVEAGAEAQSLQAARQGPQQGTVQVRGQTMSIGQGLAQVFGGRDATLARLDAERAQAAPMPADVRARLDALRAPKRPGATDTTGTDGAPDPLNTTNPRTTP